MRIGILNQYVQAITYVARLVRLQVGYCEILGCMNTQSFNIDI